MLGDVHSLPSPWCRGQGDGALPVPTPDLGTGGFVAHGASAADRGEGRECTPGKGSWAAMGEGFLPVKRMGEPGPGDMGCSSRAGITCNLGCLGLG